MKINEKERASVFSFKGCEGDRKRWRGWNMVIINILFVLVHLYLFWEGTQREREKEGNDW